MEEEKILMGQRELKTWHLMELVRVGKITLKEAGERIGVSYRQAKRIGRTIRERGILTFRKGIRAEPSQHNGDLWSLQKRGYLANPKYPKSKEKRFDLISKSQIPWFQKNFINRLEVLLTNV